MPSLLHVSASPRGAASESLAIARTFLDTLRDERPEVTIDTFDLWDGSLPEFGPDAAAAKMAVFAGRAPSGEQAAAWQAAERTFPGSPTPTTTCSASRCGTTASPTFSSSSLTSSASPAWSSPSTPNTAHRPAHREAGCRRLHQRCLRHRAPGSVRLGLPGPVLQRLAGVGRYHRHHRNPLPARPRHRRRRRRQAGGTRRRPRGRQEVLTSPGRRTPPQPGPIGPEADLAGRPCFWAGKRSCNSTAASPATCLRLATWPPGEQRGDPV